MWKAQKRPRGGGGADGQQRQGASGPATAWGNEGVEKNAAATVYVKNLPYAATMADVSDYLVDEVSRRRGAARSSEHRLARRGQTDGPKPMRFGHRAFRAAARARCER